MKNRVVRALMMALVVSLFFPGISRAAATYLAGTIVDITSTAGVLYIRLDTGRPTNCDGPIYSWIAIKDKTMISVALMLWATGQRGVTVYTDPSVGGNYCEVNQLDPT